MEEVAVSSENTITKLVLKGDIASLTNDEKIVYYKTLCDRMGLDWATKPFDYITLQGKTQLYLTKGGAEQLNKIHKASVEIRGTERIEDIYIVTARAAVAERFADSTGAVYVKGLYGEALANAFMKAETKAKRRATLSLLGLGMLDESEVHSIPNAKLEVADITREPIPTEPSSKSEFEDMKSFAALNDWTPEMLAEHCTKRWGADFRKHFTKEMLAELKTDIIQWSTRTEMGAVTV